MKWLVASLIVACGAVVALRFVDYGFYSPHRGVAAAGSPDTPTDPHARELLPLTVTDADVTRFHGRVTLAALSRFYGTDDSLRCSIQRTFSSDDPAVANRPLPVGSAVTLCLN